MYKFSSKRPPTESLGIILNLRKFTQTRVKSILDSSAENAKKYIVELVRVGAINANFDVDNEKRTIYTTTNKGFRILAIINLLAKEFCD